MSNMDHPLSLERVYGVIATTILLFCAKDYFLVTLWTVFEKLIKVFIQKKETDDACTTDGKRKLPENGSSNKNMRLLTCREISDLLIVQTLGWATILVLTTTPALTNAFLPVSELASYHVIVLLISVHIGKLIFKCFFHFFVKLSVHNGIHCAIMTLCYAGFLLPGACTIIALIGLLSDAAGVHQPANKVMDLWGVACFSKWRVLVYGAGLVITLVVRCLLPLVLIILAVTFGNPVLMSPVSLALFFFFLTYSAAVNIFLMVNVTSRFQDAKQLRCLYLSAAEGYDRTMEFALRMDRQYSKNKKEVLCQPDLTVVATVA